MDTKKTDNAVAPAGAKATVRLLSSKIGPQSAAPEYLGGIDEESIGFDPYDTASLYVQKSADQK